MAWSEVSRLAPETCVWQR